MKLTEKKKNIIYKHIWFMIIVLLAVFAVRINYEFYLFMADKGREMLKAVSISLNAMGLIVLVVLLMMTVFEMQYRSRTTRYYIGLMSTTLFALAIEIITLVHEGDKIFENVEIALTAIDLCMGEVIMVFVCFYIVAFYNSTHSDYADYKYCYVAAGFNAIGVIVTLICTCTGRVFSFNNGIYERGDLYFVVGKAASITMIFVVVWIIRSGKSWGRHDLMASLLYLLVAMIASLAEAYFGINVTYVGAAIACVMAYVALQSKEIARIQMAEQGLINATMEDTLTGLKNRRAYEEELKKAENEPFVGIIFTDMNGLKFTNDNYGHMSGDEYLCKYAELLKKRFGTQGVFRISGDEFVVIKPYVSDMDFKLIVNDLKHDILHNDGIAAVGSAYGMGKDILKLIIDAERDMYRDKKDYYERTGKDRRTV